MGETLDVKGRQKVCFALGGRKFNYQFLVCSLPTEAAGLIGIDFLKESGAIVNFECNKMSLTDIRKAPRADGTTLNIGSAFTIFWKVKRDTAINLPDGKLSVWTSKSQLTLPVRESLARLELG
jgi:hypothetical protein